MSEDLHLTGKSQRTVHGYLRAVRQLADHCRKAPDQISEAELQRYFLHRKKQHKFAYGSLRVALSGIRFFLQTTRPRDWNVLAMLRLKNVSALLDVITRALGLSVSRHQSVRVRSLRVPRKPRHPNESFAGIRLASELVRHIPPDFF
jgi:hypothetical protein